jgi:hypothetical protein
MTLVSVRLPGREYQWGATMLACLWLSPLGWLYYGWIALGPVAVLWPCLNRAARWTALTALCVPPVWPELSLVYPMGFLLLWLAVVVAAQRHGAEREVVRAHTLS